ncbi:hypothetical protein CPLU01_03426 [Colletotrichum plurivorum]|uniref:Uncharacterized protein n=1 Tax=Colletotrichum plurivorum TaxID=2175906 RepID=A0A8H6KSR0_9PEZI|nr:hypothetical protein CPLU01_03426 [Colletotrichum plurivorum]
MCWKKQTIWTVCWHTTTESGTCSKQERLVQKNLKSHHPHYQQSPRPLWMILLCCLPSEPPSPSQSRKRCPTETWTEEVERLCPRCQTIRDAPSLVPGRAPAAANSNTRFDAGGSPAKPAAVVKRNGHLLPLDGTAARGSVHPPPGETGTTWRPRLRDPVVSSRRRRRPDLVETPLAPDHRIQPRTSDPPPYKSLKLNAARFPPHSRESITATAITATIAAP